MTTATKETDGPVDVVEGLCRVMAALGGIAKMTPAERRRLGMGGGDSERGIQYAYRGVDQIAAAVQPLLAANGVVIVPYVTESETKEIVVNGKPWTDTVIRVNWSICGPNGTKIDACTEGWGRDNSDKGTNKAMTGAFKNLLLRLLCIGDPSDDTDGHTHERDNLPPAVDPISELFEQVKAAAGTPKEKVLKDFAKSRQRRLSAATLAEDPQFADQVKAIIELDTVADMIDEVTEEVNEARTRLADEARAKIERERAAAAERANKG